MPGLDGGRAMIEVISRLVRASQRMRREAARGATSAELAEQMDLPLVEVEEAMRIAKGMVLLELPANEQDAEEQEVARPPAQGFTAREERVLCMRFGIRLETDPALERLGRQLLETRKRIRAMEANAGRDPDEPEPA